MNLALLSKRELQVVKLVVDGMSNRQIAEHLTLSRETVVRHLGNIFDKLGCGSRTELTAWWYQSGEHVTQLQAENDALRAELATLQNAYRALQKLTPYAQV